MTWDDYHMRIAETAALKSKDATKVGAILVGPAREVRLTAFNGPPMGVRDIPERRERPAKYLFASHAEQNLVAFAARIGAPIAGCHVFVTHHPCADCAKALIQAGVASITYGEGQTSMPEAQFTAAHEMLAEAGVTLNAWRKS